MIIEDFDKSDCGFLISTLLFIADVTSGMSYYVLLEDNLAREEQATTNMGKILSIYMN